LDALAHDLNNLLTTIVGDADLLVASLPEGPEREDAAEILHAGRRAADLIRRLPGAQARDGWGDWEDDALVAHDAGAASDAHDASHNGVGHPF
jgi:hypothetical protein